MSFIALMEFAFDGRSEAGCGSLIHREAALLFHRSPGKAGLIAAALICPELIDLGQTTPVKARPSLKFLRRFPMVGAACPRLFRSCTSNANT